MQDWWKKYFGEGWQQVQSYGHIPEEIAFQADFIASILTDHDCQKVVDVPCAYGRMTMPLAARGFDMIGLDYDPHILKEAAKRAAAADIAGIHWQQGDMRAMDFEGELDAVLCLFGSFGYFEDANNRRFLKSAHKALKPGGTFLLETHTMETLLPIFTPRNYWKLGNCVILEERNFNFEAARLEGTWTIIKEGEETNYDSSIRIYSYKELIQLLDTCGFEVLDTFADFDGMPFYFGADNLLLVLKKK